MIVNKDEQYTRERFDAAVGTKNTFMSNFHQLQIPITDEYGNKYWNSEGYYMALRTHDEQIKKEIAATSKLGGSASRKARNKYKLETDEKLRTMYMQTVIQKKFDANPELKQMLIEVKQEIVEKNYWHDTLFGVDDQTLKGANVLGKCLMNYRDRYK